MIANVARLLSPIKVPFLNGIFSYLRMPRKLHADSQQLPSTLSYSFLTELDRRGWMATPLAQCSIFGICPIFGRLSRPLLTWTPRKKPASPIDSITPVLSASSGLRNSSASFRVGKVSRNHDAAILLRNRLETALVDRNSKYWQRLKTGLPEPTYQRFASFAGVTGKHVPTWSQLETAFNIELQQRIYASRLESSRRQRLHVIS
jgi:hypothetical protein